MTEAIGYTPSENKPAALKRAAQKLGKRSAAWTAKGKRTRAKEALKCARIIDAMRVHLLERAGESAYSMTDEELLDD